MASGNANKALTVSEQEISLSGIGSGTARFTKIDKLCAFCIDNLATLSAISKNTMYSIGTIPEGYRPKTGQRLYPMISSGYANMSATYPIHILLNTNGVLQAFAAVDYPGGMNIYCNIVYVTE